MLLLDSTQLHVPITVDSSWKARHDTASPRLASPRCICHVANVVLHPAVFLQR